MCLYVKPGSRKTAKKDIHVWKAIAVDKNDPDHWFGPFQYDSKRFNFNEKVETDAPEESSMKTCKNLLGNDVIVESGFIHSCGNIRIARIMLHMTDFPSKVHGGYVTKAIIPKGAVYYCDSEQEGGYSSYASSSIIVKKPENL